jgi:hypothetical protein
MASSMGFDHEPAGTPSDRDTTAGFTALAATQSSPANSIQPAHTIWDAIQSSTQMQQIIFGDVNYKQQAQSDT